MASFYILFCKTSKKKSLDTFLILVCLVNFSILWEGIEFVVP